MSKNSTPLSPETPLWTPSEARVESARITEFSAEVNAQFGTEIEGYDDLYDWSTQYSEDFWEQVWDQFDVIGDKGIAPYLKEPDDFLLAQFFPSAKLNYAENLLRPRDRDSEALVFWSEDKLKRRLSFGDLCDQVSQLQQYLSDAGVVPGDRIAAYLPNMPETIVAMLATSSLGATFASASPDFGTQGVLDRFAQIEPKVLLTTDSYNYAGKKIDITSKVVEVVEQLPSLERVLICPLDGGRLKRLPKAYNKLGQAAVYATALDAYDAQELFFHRQDFDDPLYIMFSSGTTGAPKCIVHRQGGVLLKHLSEHGLCCDIKKGDRVFYFTTCGWMMWNWLVSALALEATVVLYDGSPFHPAKDILFDLVDQEALTFMGTSAKYVDGLRKADVDVMNSHDLSSLRTIASTGSTLVHESFDYLYEKVKNDVCVSSVSGGTDIVGCFMGGSPVSAVYRGQIQKRILGIATDVFSIDGNPVQDQRGELVCTKPFPTVPLGFLNDPDDVRFKDAYFNRFGGIWTHGDFVSLTKTGGMIVYGRSDATLNPGGVRIGTAEIYRQVESLELVAEALVIGQDWEDDTRVILFVKLADGHVLTRESTKAIKAHIRENCSPRHVPAVILDVQDIPRTRSGKITELAVSDVVHGRELKNIEALANPEALEEYRNRAELQAGYDPATTPQQTDVSADKKPLFNWFGAKKAPTAVSSGDPETQAHTQAGVAADERAEEPAPSQHSEPELIAEPDTEAASYFDDPAETDVDLTSTSVPQVKKEEAPQASRTDEQSILIDEDQLADDVLMMPLDDQKPMADAKGTSASSDPVTTGLNLPNKQEGLLLEALPSFLTLAKAKAPFWTTRLASTYVDGINDRTSYKNSVPVTPIAQIYNDQDRKPPMGGYVTTPLKDLKQLIVSPEGVKTPVGSNSDWSMSAPALEAAGMEAGDLLINAFSFDGGVFGPMIQSAAASSGIVGISVGDSDIAGILKTLISAKATCFAGPAAVLDQLLRLCLDQGVSQLPLLQGLLDVNATEFDQDLLAKFPALSLSGCMMSDLFGMVAYQARGEKAYVCSDRLLVEICKPGTGMPVLTGEIGELVLTRLEKHVPLFRIATGVLTRELQDYSILGLTNTKIAGWMGPHDKIIESDDGVKINGSQILSTIEAVEGLRRALLQADILGLTLNVTVQDQANEDAVAKEAVREFQAQSGLEVRVTVRPAGSLNAYSPLLVDKRLKR